VDVSGEESRSGPQIGPHELCFGWARLQPRWNPSRCGVMGRVTLEIPEGADRLPAGRHKATIADIEAALVSAFPTSTSRRPLFDRWVLVREAVARIVPITAEWVNGSFVTTKVDPKDIDVVTHLEGAGYEQLDEVQRVTLVGLVGGKRSKPLHGCDSFALVEYPDGHPARAAYTMASRYWESVWGTHRDGRPKGYIEVVVAND
jgi:hypothetical protein